MLKSPRKAKATEADYGGALELTLSAKITILPTNGCTRPPMSCGIKVENHYAQIAE
jgi:hypothetical protein